MVTTGYRSLIVDTNGNYLLQFGSKGASDGQLDSPYDVTVHN